MPYFPDDPLAEPEPPSKGSRKRAAHDAQRLGERLVTLSDAVVAALDLPEPLLDAIRAARSIRTHGGLARQRQLIGKLMRQIDLQPVIEALAATARGASQDIERFQRIEAWRDRLIAEGEPALSALLAAFPELPRDALGPLLARSRDPARSSAERSAAARALFRQLRESLAAR